MIEINLEQAKAYLKHLNLDYIVAAMSSDYYPLARWTRQDAEHCAQLYKRFLILQKIHVTETLVPTREIDEFWHNHILYTQNYINDCLHIFGHYLHHSPSSPEDNPQELASQFLKTKELYFKEFNQTLDLIKSNS